jgi:pimeloyl-ACP methyl ester carboxylesterase
MTMQTLPTEVAGYQIATSRWPGPGPTVVLLHAGVCDRRSWYRTAEHLTGLGSLIAYDRRGYGDSPVSATPYRDVDDLWAVLDGVSEPVWLVGSSMGGLLALDAVVTAPDRVAGLVLIGPAISGAPEPETLEPRTEALFERLGAAREAGDLAERLRVHTQIWLDGPAADGVRVSGPARDLALAMNTIVLRNDVDDEEGSAGVDAWSQLEQISTPATVAWGDLDLPELIADCEVLAARLPRARRVVLPGTAHLPYLEQPKLVADLIREAVELPS